MTSGASGRRQPPEVVGSEGDVYSFQALSLPERVGYLSAGRSSQSIVDSMPVKNTFIDFAEVSRDSDEHSLSSKSRSSSEPPASRRREPFVAPVLPGEASEGPESTRHHVYETSSASTNSGSCHSQGGANFRDAEEGPNDAPNTSRTNDAPNPNDLLPTWSVGAKNHSAGSCPPCGWYWKTEGCRRGEACQFCHLCDESVMKTRKAKRMEAMRLGRRVPAQRRRAPIFNKEEAVPVGPQASVGQQATLGQKDFDNEADRGSRNDGSAGRMPSKPAETSSSSRSVWVHSSQRKKMTGQAVSTGKFSL